MYRQTRIFVPTTVPFDTPTWAETVIGGIIAPTLGHEPGLRWFWFSRYCCSAERDSDDCDISAIPDEFRLPNGLLRSVRFRYSITDERCQAFESSCQFNISNLGCWVSDFRTFDFTGDLGSDRHVGGERTELRRQTRAQLVAEFYHAISRLVVHALIGPDELGRYELETNDSPQNPLDSSFETLHHLFCNITDVPLRVFASQNSLRTDWSQQTRVSLTNEEQALKVRF
jgi:hypothetical protein